jgi:hypothetical protein
MFNYYYVVSSFPPICLGQKSEITYEEARQSIAINATAADWKKVELFQRLSDIRNIRAFWLRQPLDSRGNFTEKQIEELLLVGGNIPPFAAAFLDRYETIEDRLRYFPALVADMYRETMPELNGFLQKYYQMERKIRLCLTALRAKAAHRNLVRELQFEDPSDPFVAQLLAQKDEKEVVLPENDQDLKNAFWENQSEPKKLHRAILQIRFERIQEMGDERPFTIDEVIGFLARLSIVEAWSQMDEEKGRAALQDICRG